ncbi:craniofacial development protein 1-like [Brassica napus]|uniref:craniofacial development protein 1-like n=1 Tax=Brassica napus TaxID=3708 RepID=UPI0020786337|nr:craniofacial development protein 1-like [Brassica napus]
MASPEQSERNSPEKTGSNSVSKKVSEIWERMNEGVPNKRFNFVSKTSTSSPPAKKTANSNWKSYLGIDAKKRDTIVQKEDSVLDSSCSEEAKRIAAAALAAVRNATATAAAASSRGKIEITEVKDFAGQEIEVKRLVEAGSKEASSSSAMATSGVDAVLEQIKKKQKLSVLDKTKKDWGEYKEENKGVEDELDKYKKSSDKYLDKVSFLERADYRQFEKERDARLALQSKRRLDDV